MSKVPLKQLSVNTFESQRVASPIKKSAIIKKKSKHVEEKPLDTKAILQQSTRMTTNEFETFVQTTAPDEYWHIMAEFYRTKLEDVTRENQQVEYFQWMKIEFQFVFVLASWYCRSIEQG